MTDRGPVEPHLFVVVGATGDLMRRKLLPALYHLTDEGFLGSEAHILGAAREALDDDGFRTLAREALAEADFDEKALSEWCDHRLHYHCLAGEESDYGELADRIATLEEAHDLPGNRAFYLALPPRVFPVAIEGLGDAGLSRSPGWTRIVVEKPFGRDLESARKLNARIHRHFDESQVYRIDHYLGKDTVQNLLVFRLSNAIFESLWNRDRIDHVEITVAESLGVGSRAGYYDEAGALRDMVQNHVTQLLSLTAMEVPAVFEADAIRNEKVKVLRAARRPTPGNVIFGQYVPGRVDGREVAGYREEDGVDAESRTETYAGLKVEIENWRWQGVPFYLRTGKRLARKHTSIAVTFRQPPVCLFESMGGCDLHSNVLLITLQPDEGFSLDFEVKAPGEPFSVRTHTLEFGFHEAYDSLPDAYETLLLDILEGDQTLFVRADEVEGSWSLYTPLLESRSEVELDFYPAGSWGPDEGRRLLTRDRREWVIPREDDG